MTSIITPFVAQQFAAVINAAGTKPDLVRSISFQFKPASIDTDAYTLGVRFHGLLSRIKDHASLSHREKCLLPALNVLRDELRNLGVRYISPEVPLAGKGSLPNARCDLLLEGGYAPRGVAEVKVTDSIPQSPRDAHLMQLAIYEELVAVQHPKDSSKLWGCIAYVSFPQKRIRLFAYRDVVLLRRTALELLAA